MDSVIEGALAECQQAQAALAKVPDDEANQVRSWFVDIARAVASASKGVGPNEQATIDKIAAVFVTS